MERFLAFAVRSPEQPGLEIRVNFGMHAGRQATAAEIQELGAALLPEIGEAEIVAEERFEIGPESEADVHQVRIAVPRSALPADDFLVGELAGRLVAIAERWATSCIADRHVEVSEL
ncbi:MAG TPA: hypothetical protein VFA66_12760 [Gaiellaceae bacterium]|nr:hypothetical protein [Gaiellaceae bacterium]